MNEQELERRFRSVTDGTQPNAPQSLRQFLHALPEAAPVRRENPISRLLRTLTTPAQMPRLAFGAAAVAFAIVVAIVGSTLLMSARNDQVLHTPSPAPSTPTPNPTFMAGGFLWHGNLDTHAIVPLVAVAGGPDGYLGVGIVAGKGVLLTSHDALDWSAKKVDAIDTATVSLQWLARGASGFVAVGQALSPDGALLPEPRFYFSSDGDTWEAAQVPDELKGAPARTVVAGADGFLAAGWNEGDNHNYLWKSADGRKWEGGISFQTVKGETFLLWTNGMYMASGDPVPTSHEYQNPLPIFKSMDGVQNWTQSYGDASIGNIGPAISGVSNEGSMKTLLVVGNSDGTELIAVDSGDMWMPLKTSLPGKGLRSVVVVGQDALLASGLDGKIFVTMDWGGHWQVIGFDDPSRAAPTGKTFFDIGNGKYLLVGDNGLWVAEPV